MHNQPLCRFPIPALDELPDDSRQRFEEVQLKAGFIPNIFLILGRVPREATK